MSAIVLSTSFTIYQPFSNRSAAQNSGHLAPFGVFLLLV